jgi:predicted RNA-binding Zn-ribbon protein involved in translation (DUF1610 family)
MQFLEGEWLYLIEDAQWNLKLGFSANLYRRLYTYSQTRTPPIGTKFAMAEPKCWVLGVRPGTRQEEGEFHRAHADEAILGGEWYSFKSRAAALLLLQNWQEPPMQPRIIWSGEGPHYALVHRKTTSDLASLLSRSRLSKRGAAIVLHPCPHCGKKYGARELRAHQYSCPSRTGKRYRPAPMADGAFETCVLSPAEGTRGFHRTAYHCPKCGVCLCIRHRGEHNRLAHPRELASRPKPGSKGKPSHNPAGRPKKVKQ